MDFNPDDAQRYLEGVEYPASKEDLVRAAEGNGAPEALLGMIRTLPAGAFSSQQDVMDQLRAYPGTAG